MPGTAEDPVKIGPWKRLKEVHWGKRYIAIEMRILGTLEGFDPTSCSPREQTINLGDGVPWSGSGLQTFRGGYYPDPNTTVSDEDKVQNALLYSGSGWTGLEWGDYGVSGLPDWPSGGEQGFSPFQYAGPEDGDGPRLRAGSALDPPFDISVPLEPGVTFNEGLDVAMVSKANTYSGDQVCTEIFGNPGVFTLMAIQTLDNSSELEMDYPASSIAITYGEKTYEAVATKVIGTERLWVLFRKTAT